MGDTQEGQGRWMLLAEMGAKEPQDLWGHRGLQKVCGDKVLLEGGAGQAWGQPCRTRGHGATAWQGADTAEPSNSVSPR